ncbi:ABC transporter substrate-binding protein [Atopobacter phocae]|uniref:ABC transporter substrate-binding protein n=1 Tax=Atopobacter phocae TaxID=136492 RepID=UPI00046F3D90|nr:ABC transporter substrate-binding protein [Atopobacter phocae]
MNQWTKGLTLVASATLLAACSTGGSDSKKADSKKDGVVEITLWHAMNGPHQEALTKLVDEYNESQDKYKVIEQNQGDYKTLTQSIMAAGSSKTLPTIAQATPSNVPDFAGAGILAPLDDVLMTEDGFKQDELDQIYPGFMEGTKFDGKTYSMPFSKSARIMFVNEDILKEYNMTEIKTWDDVKKLGEAMKAKGDDRVAMGLENDVLMELETMARQNGADWISEDLKNIDIDSPKIVETLEFIKEGLDNNWINTAGEEGYYSGIFGRGQSALYIGSSAGIAHVEPVAEENKLNWSTAEIPVFGEGEPLTLFAGNDLTVFKSASKEQMAGAINFIKFLLEAEQTADWAIQTGYLPITKGGVESKEYQEFLKENPRQEAAIKELPYGKNQAKFVGSGEYRNIALQAIDQIISGDAKPADVLKNLQKQTTEIVNKSK